ncbi:hypothetical protein BGX27_001717 [Mortierella sp. AM989]|nr:hypothetical protein BGX27_001717 [Mortierella sp. AM989]
MRTSLILSVATAFLSSCLIQRTDAQQLCNGYAALCSKTYDQVTYATTHNAYSYTPKAALALNQNNDISTQLGDGIRALMLDAYKANTTNEIELCHTSCSLLDAGPLSRTLGQIKAFLEANPNEVITILWENSEGLSPAQFQTVYAAAGVSDYLYTQPTGSTAWPTLADMISSGKRLVNFIASGGGDNSVAWLMSEYDYVFETPYQIKRGAEYLCTVDRPKDERKQMYVLNHFVSESFTASGQTIDIPQPGAAATTNGPELVTHVNTCLSTFSQNPTFITVDFYEKGTILETTAQLNGVTWNGKAATQPKPSGAASAMSNVNAKVVGMVALATALGLLTL